MADQHNVRVVRLSNFFDVDCMHMLCYDAFLWRRLRALWKYNELAWTNQNQILMLAVLKKLIKGKQTKRFKYHHKNLKEEE